MEDQDERPITRISNLAMRTLSINTSLQDNLAKCHIQDQSPLYSRLPKEIRDLIFAFATAQYEDRSRPYEATAFWYRPGHTAPHKTCTNLLLTCRRIWLETNALPMKQAVFTYWYLKVRAPPYCQGSHDRYVLEFYDDFDNLTELNKANYNTLHLFLQMCSAEQLFSEDSIMSTSDPILTFKKIHITIRHTDWWWWERDEPLRLEDAWVQRALNCMTGVQEVKLELETLERKKDQLQVIVDRLSQMTSSVTMTKNSATRLEIIEPQQVWHWNGPANINEEEYQPYKGMKTLEYRVVVLTWRRVTCFPEEQETSSTLGIETRQAPEMSVSPRSMLDLQEHRYWIERESFERAQNVEDEMQWRFMGKFADVEVRKFEEKWRLEGSLLKFGTRLLRLPEY